MVDYPDKHTPGPWQLKQVTNSRGKVTRYRIYSGHDYGQHTDVAREPQEADARLIAAGPDLLEALEELVEQAQIAGDALSRMGAGATRLGLAQTKAKRAIAKARGD